jgi:hypothetical protein
MKPAEVKSIIRAYDALKAKIIDRRDSPEDGKEDWNDVIQGNLIRGRMMGALKDECPNEWRKWAKTERWQIYRVLQEGDFPDCIPHLQEMLQQSCFEYQKYFPCVDKSARDAAKRLNKRISLLQVNKPVWNVITFKKITHVYDSGFYVRLDVVDTNGVTIIQDFSHNWKNWRAHPEQDKESCKKFFASKEAQDMIAEAKVMLVNQKKQEITSKLCEIVNTAFNSGFNREDLLTMVDCALVEAVYKS